MAEKETDLRKVKELVELMKQNDLVEIQVIDGENKILLKRPQPAPLAQMAPVITQIPVPQVQAAAIAGPASAPAEAAQKPEDDYLVDIPSPIVGTFYSSPSPDSDPYVDVGDKVGPDTVVCIIEAMKVMNEIKAEAAGTIVELMCQAGQAVEYGQALFKIRPD